MISSPRSVTRTLVPVPETASDPVSPLLLPLESDKYAVLCDLPLPLPLSVVLGGIDAEGAEDDSDNCKDEKRDL